MVVNENPYFPQKETFTSQESNLYSSEIRVPFDSAHFNYIYIAKYLHCIFIRNSGWGYHKPLPLEETLS